MSTFSFCPSGQKDGYKGGRGRPDHMANEINGGKTDKVG